MAGQADNNVMQAAGGNAGTRGLSRPATDGGPAPAQPGDNMHRGWVKLWRKWRDHEMASDPNATLVFLHLLTEARREPKENRRYGYTVQRGQCDLTVEQLETLTGLSTDKVRQALKRLERYGTIQRTTQRGKVPAITTIVNYDTYNPDAPECPTQRTGQTPAKPRLNPGQTPTPGEVEKVEKTTLGDSGESPAEKYPPGFVQFWDHYPRKVGKGAAFKVWKRMSRPDKEAAIDRAEWFAGCWKHHDPHGDRASFIPHPATWTPKLLWSPRPVTAARVPLLLQTTVPPRLRRRPRPSKLTC